MEGGGAVVVGGEVGVAGVGGGIGVAGVGGEVGVAGMGGVTSGCTTESKNSNWSKASSLESSGL